MEIEPQPSPAEPTPTSRARIVVRLVVSLLLAAAFVWAMRHGGLPLMPPGYALSQLRWWAAPAFVLLTIGSTFFRSYRLVYLLRPIRPEISPTRVVAIGLLGYGAIFFAPLRLGEVVRPYLLARDNSARFTEGLGIVTAERIVDGLATVLLTALGLALSTQVSPLPEQLGELPIPVSLVPQTLVWATVLFTLAFAAMAGVYAARRWVVSVVHASLGALSPRLASASAHVVERIVHGFSFLTSWRSGGMFLLHTVACWVLGGAAHWALLCGVGLPASLTVGCVTMGMIALGSLLPAGPGFFGPYQLSAYTSMAMFFAPSDVLAIGAMHVFVSYVAHVLLSIAMIVMGFVMLKQRPPPRGSAPTAFTGK